MSQKIKLKSWSEWLSLREDNARKRAVRDALAGTKPPLPGSYAACPSTNPRAMKQAEKTGVVDKDPKKLIVKEESKPDYSFDKWLKKAAEFGDDFQKIVGDAEEEDKDFDKKTKAEKDQVEKLKSKESAEKEEPWKQPKQIHKDRSKDLEKEDTPSSSKKSSDRQQK